MQRSQGDLPVSVEGRRDWSHSYSEGEVRRGIMNKKTLLPLLLLALCHCGPQAPGFTIISVRSEAVAIPSSTIASVHNGTDSSTTVYVSFGSDSKITASDWSFCVGGGLNCSFPLAEGASQDLPGTSYLNATLSFDAEVGCGVTKAELNINNPQWYDTLDVSLVDGFSNKVQISATPTGKSPLLFGPPSGQTGDRQMLGVFPVGCDICVERQNPPCGIAKGKFDCKDGTQYDPTPPCQWQGPTMGGGDLAVEVQLMK